MRVGKEVDIVDVGLFLFFAAVSFAFSPIGRIARRLRRC